LRDGRKADEDRINRTETGCEAVEVAVEEGYKSVEVVCVDARELRISQSWRQLERKKEMYRE
jgi:hypothetical protein